MNDLGPGWWEPYTTSGALNPAAVAGAARALAIYEGDGRLYDEDPDAREGFAERVRIVVGIYLEQQPS